jgi:hypothetical protein
MDMLGIGGAFGRKITAGACALALVACGGSVEVASTSGTGAGGGASTSGTSSSGGGGSLPPPACAPGEGAIVIARALDHSVIAVGNGGTWTENDSVAPAMATVATYVDVDHHLGAFWIDWSTWKSHFATTIDGTSFDVRDVKGWDPGPDALFGAVTTSMILGADAKGTRLARFDPDAHDWYPYLAPAPITATSAAPLGKTGEILVVGLGPNSELCDVATTAGAWGSVHCRDDVHVATVVSGEISLTPPRAVGLPNGDVVVVYYPKAPDPDLTLAATTLHAGAWSAPDESPPGTFSVMFAATATPTGDVIVGVASGGALALRYTPGTGWGAPIPPNPPAGFIVSAAPGICGDDALLLQSGAGAGDGLRVLRVRGDVAETLTTVGIGEKSTMNGSISTRPASAL